MPELQKIYETTLEQMHEGIQVISRDWTYLYLNKAAVLHGQNQRENMIGRTMMDVYPGIEKTEMFQTLRGCLEKDVSRQMENEFEYPDGHRRWFELFVEPHTEGLLIRSIDITEKKKLQEQLWHSQKLDAVGKLSGEIAHDLGNRFAIMTLRCEMALGKTADEFTTRTFKSLLDSVNQSASITKQLLAFSRKQILDFKVVNLNQLLEPHQKNLPKLMGDSIQTEFRLSNTTGNVRVDTSQFDQVILNLCMNARDAMPDGGKLTIETGVQKVDKNSSLVRDLIPGDYFVLSVSDTGKGMPKEILEKIFDPYYTTKNRGYGVGLGLSTVHGIVKQCNGHVSVTSQPGVGSTFQVFFPKAQGDSDKASSSEPQEEGKLQSGTILLVEDDAELRETLRSVLGDAGYRVLACDSAESGRKVFEREGKDIQLLLTDVTLPQTNGVHLASALRQKTPNLKIIFMSGYSEELVLNQQGLNSKVILVRKPANTRTLLEVVRRAVNGSLQRGVF